MTSDLRRTARAACEVAARAAGQGEAVLSWQFAHPGVRLEGALSGDGTEMMHTVVYRNPVGQPPPELHGLVAPVHDPAGQLCDWRLAPVQSNLNVSSEDIDHYRQWRAKYATDTYIGERALVLAFVAWADHHFDVSGLRFLRSEAAYIDNAHVYKLRSQLDRLRSALADSKKLGLGLHMPPDHRAAARAIIPTDPATTLLATPGASLTAGPDGLILAAGEPAQQIPVTGWTRHDAGVTVSTPNGQVELPDSPGAWLLNALGRDQPEVAVRPQTMSSLVAPTLMFLRDAADTAVSCHTGLSTRTGLS